MGFVGGNRNEIRKDYDKYTAHGVEKVGVDLRKSETLDDGRSV